MRSYAHLVRGDAVIPAGYVEATRGCLHTLPALPDHAGLRWTLLRRAARTVLADIRAQVAAGAGHITFGDPDFLNGPGHALAIVRALHAEFPHVTFDATIKVEHILERREIIPELAYAGLRVHRLGGRVAQPDVCWPPGEGSYTRRCRGGAAHRRRGGHPYAPNLRRFHSLDHRARTTWNCSTSSRSRS